VNQAVVPPCSLHSIPATPPRKAALVATEETARGEWRGVRFGSNKGRVLSLNTAICIYICIHTQATPPRKAALVATEETGHTVLTVVRGRVRCEIYYT